jgi:hypothetical protein
MFSGWSSLRSMFIPSSVQSMGYECFLNCPVLSSLVFERGCQVSSFRGRLFEKCGSLKSLCLPASLKTFGEPVASYLRMTYVTIEDGNRSLRLSHGLLVDLHAGSCRRYFGKEETVVIPADINEISGWCFAGTSGLFHVFFAGRSVVSRLGESAFEGCSSLQSICIPASVESLEANCFADCLSLSTVEFERRSRVLNLNACVFRGCLSLVTICIPKSAHFLFAYRSLGAFAECRGLVSVTFEASSAWFPSWVPDWYFSFGTFCGCSSLKSICIPARVTSLGEECFLGCVALSTVTFESESRLRSLCIRTFKGCSSLGSICIPRMVHGIGEQCFHSCRALSQVIFEPTSMLNDIGDSAFANCSSLGSIHFPAGVQTVGPKCFVNCLALRTVGFGYDSRVSRIADSAFTNCPRLVEVIMPASAMMRCPIAVIRVVMSNGAPRN